MVAKRGKHHQREDTEPRDEDAKAVKMYSSHID